MRNKLDAHIIKNGVKSAFTVLHTHTQKVFLIVDKFTREKKMALVKETMKMIEMLVGVFFKVHQRSDEYSVDDHHNRLLHFRQMSHNCR